MACVACKTYAQQHFLQRRASPQHMSECVTFLDGLGAFVDCTSAGQSLDNAVVAVIVTGQLLPFGQPHSQRPPSKAETDRSNLLRFTGGSAPTPAAQKVRR